MGRAAYIWTKMHFTFLIKHTILTKITILTKLLTKLTILTELIYIPLLSPGEDGVWSCRPDSHQVILL